MEKVLPLVGFWVPRPMFLGEDGLWTVFPNGFWRMGYRVDESTRERLQAVSADLMPLNLFMIVLALPLGLAIKVMMNRAAPSLFSNSDSWVDTAAVCVWPAAAFAVAMFIIEGGRISDVLRQYALSTVMLSPKEGRARWIESPGKPTFGLGAGGTCCFYLISVLSFAGLIYQALNGTHPIRPISDFFLIAMALYSAIHGGIAALRLIAYRQDRRFERGQSHAGTGSETTEVKTRGR